MGNAGGSGESRARRLVLDGGGQLPSEAMGIFKAWAKQNHATSSTGALCSILIVPWASEREAEEHIADAEAWITEEDQIKIVIAPSISQINDSAQVLASAMAMIEAANGIFITGGDQVRFMTLLDAKQQLQRALTRQFRAGVGIAGTSAGTAAMGQTMITGEGGSDSSAVVPWDFISAGRVQTRPGLGFTPNIVCDQHFTLRGRMNRLISVLLAEETPERYGLGIDEDVAVVVESDTQLRVFSDKPGLSAVLLTRGGDDKPNTFALEILPANGSVVRVAAE